MSSCTPRLEQVAGTDALALVRDILEVQCPTHLLIEVREGDVPEHRQILAHAFGFPWEGPILNIAGSSAFILSARLSLTSATPSSIVRRMRSSVTLYPLLHRITPHCDRSNARRLLHPAQVL